MSTQFPPDLLERAKNIKLVLMDVDGVLTDGKLYYLPAQITAAAGVTREKSGADGCKADMTLSHAPVSEVPLSNSTSSDTPMVEFKSFNSHDGVGLYLLNDCGIPTGVISGRVSPATVERARILKMKYVHQGKMDKVASWEEILADAAVTDKETAYIGDDFPDVPLLKRAGLAIAVGDARPELKAISHFITPSVGGSGAVRDAAELILKAKGLWSNCLQKYGLELATSDK